MQQREPATIPYIPNELLKYAREQKDLTQEKLARALTERAWELNLDITSKKPKGKQNEENEEGDIDAKTIRRWESGETRNPDGARKKLLEDYFEKPIEALGFTKKGKPSFWNLSQKKNELFTGRESILAHLESVPFLRNEHNRTKQESEFPLKQRPQVLTGVGGVGKTQIAVSYAYRYQREYHTIIWLNASSLTELTSEFARIAEVLRLVEEKDIGDQRKMIAEAKTWLSSKYLTRWLLIFDNVDSPEIVHGIVSLLPQNYYGHVLLLSRMDDPGAEVYGLQQIRVNSLPEGKGATLLLRRAGFLDIETSVTQVAQDDQQQALALSHTLDGLPLALDQAGAYIREIPITLSEYAMLYEMRRAELLRHRGNYGFSHPESVVVTWLLNFERVGSEAQEQLQLFAFLAPEYISEELVTCYPSGLGPVLEPVASDKQQLVEAVKALRRFSLINRYTAERVYTIHRLVQAVIQDEMEVQTQRVWAERAMRVVCRVFADTDVQREGTSEWWRRYAYYLPHAHSCFVLYTERSYFIAELMHLFDSIAFYLYQCNRFDETYQFYDCAKNIKESVFGSEHPQAVRAQNNMGVLEIKRGNYEKANEQLKLVLKTSLNQAEPDYLVLGACCNNFGVLRYSQGRLEDAEAFCQAAVTYLKKVKGEPLRLSSAQENLVQLYQERGRGEDAKALRVQVGRPDALDASTDEGIQQAMVYMTGGPDFLGMEASTEFPLLPSLLSSLNAFYEQTKEKTGISPTEIASMMDTFAQFYKVYAEQGSEKALAFFRDAVKPYWNWREEDDALMRELLPLQMQILETVFRLEGPEFDDTRETDISSDEVGESFLNVFQQFRSIPSKAKGVFPIWLSDLDLTEKLIIEGSGQEPRVVTKDKSLLPMSDSTTLGQFLASSNMTVDDIDFQSLAWLSQAEVGGSVDSRSGVSELKRGIVQHWAKLNAEAIIEGYNRRSEQEKEKRKTALSLVGLTETENEEILASQIYNFYLEYSNGRPTGPEIETLARVVVEGCRRNGEIDFALLDEHLGELLSFLAVFGKGEKRVNLLIRDQIKLYAVLSLPEQQQALKDAMVRDINAQSVRRLSRQERDNYWKQIAKENPELSTFAARLELWSKNNAKLYISTYNNLDEATREKRKAAFSLLGITETSDEGVLSNQLKTSKQEYFIEDAINIEKVARAVVEGSRRGGVVDYGLLEEHLSQLQWLLKVFGGGDRVALLIRDRIKAYVGVLPPEKDEPS
jgi:transcriptional regulator with XRE-family HTH domain